MRLKKLALLFKLNHQRRRQKKSLKRKKMRKKHSYLFFS